MTEFSQLVTDFPEIREIDINPLVVDESSAVAVDARIVVDTDRIMREVAEHREHPCHRFLPEEVRCDSGIEEWNSSVVSPDKT